MQILKSFLYVTKYFGEKTIVKKTQKVWFIVHESFVLSFIEEVEQPEGNVNNAVLDKKL